MYFIPLGGLGTTPPEAGSALDHYVSILPALKERFKLIAHGHPLARAIHKPMYEKLGIEFVDDFEEVCQRAGVYVNDLSSTLYEFLITGKPVVVLNAPWFRREKQWGIRFWDYSNIGINVENPGDLIDAIDKTIKYPFMHLEERKQAIMDLYPYLGYSSMRASSVIYQFLETL